MITQPLNGKTGVEQNLSDAKICKSALGQPTSLNAEWMKDMGKDSKLLQKEIFGRCTVHAKALALGSRSDLKMKANP